MWPDWVSNPGPLTYESSALPTPLEDEAFLKGGILYKPIALRKATIVYNFGLSECNRVKEAFLLLEEQISQEFTPI